MIPKSRHIFINFITLSATVAGTIGLYGGISLNKNDENVVRAMSLAASVCVQTFLKNGYRVGLVKKFNKLLQKKLNELFGKISIL